ncbi:MAG: nucleotidyltransferase domain-containing protein [Saprospiraceae bacterium]|nr:nucleotidyltransferase domain-containing protein [Saprospiraceae bacterium]
MFARQNIIKAVHELISSAQAHDLPIERVLLFGSYAKGIPHKYSDIDLALFSSKFVENPHKNMELIQCARRLPQMQLHLYTLADFYDHPFVEEIKKHAIELKF